MESPKADDDCDSMKADESLDPEEKAEVKEEIEEAHHTVDSADDMNKCDDDDDTKEVETTDEGVKDDSARADSMKIASLERELKALRKAMAPQATNEREEIAKAIHRADSVFMSMGEPSVTHVPGESAFAFRKRIATRLAKFSNRFKDVEISKIADVKLFNPIEDAIYADSIEYSKAPPIKAGSVHMIERKMGNLSVWEPSSNSDPHGWMDTFSNGVQFRGGFINK
jgi:hypothetical protein